MKREETLEYNIKTLWHSITRLYNHFGNPYAITASTGFVLLNINVVEGTPATKIAPLLGMESRSLTRMLKSLEDKGWIYKRKDALDGRLIRIFLSDLGKEKRELSRRAVKEFNNKIRQLVDSDKLKTFITTLNQINEIAMNTSLFDKISKKISNEFNINNGNQ